MGWESLIEGLEALLVQPGGAGLVLLLASRPCMVGRSPQQPPLVEEGCRIFSHPKNFGLLLSVANSGAQGVLGTSAGRVSGL